MVNILGLEERFCDELAIRLRDILGYFGLIGGISEGFAGGTVGGMVFGPVFSGGGAFLQVGEAAHVVAQIFEGDFDRGAGEADGVDEHPAH